MNPFTPLASAPRLSAAAPRWTLLRIRRITTWLIASAALVNAVYDITAASLKWPRTVAEADNLDLFVLHYQEPPLKNVNWSVDTGRHKAQAKFLAYANGDIHVTLDRDSRWFRSPFNPRPASWVSRLVPSAHAQAPAASGLAAPPPAVGDRVFPLRNAERLEGQRLLRYQELPDGRAEELEFDIRTGRVVRRDIVPAGSLFRADTPRRPTEFRSVELAPRPR